MKIREIFIGLVAIPLLIPFISAIGGACDDDHPCSNHPNDYNYNHVVEVTNLNTDYCNGAAEEYKLQITNAAGTISTFEPNNTNDYQALASSELQLKVTGISSSTICGIKLSALGAPLSGGEEDDFCESRYVNEQHIEPNTYCTLIFEDILKVPPSDIVELSVEFFTSNDCVESNEIEVKINYD